MIHTVEQLLPYCSRTEHCNWMYVGSGTCYEGVGGGGGGGDNGGAAAALCPAG